MTILEIFSKRKRRERGEFPDVYVYENLPDTLRVQIVHIIQDAFGHDLYQNNAAMAYQTINDALCREYGVFKLIEDYRESKAAVLNFFLKEKSIERALDVIELCFQLVNTYIRDNYNYHHYTERKIEPDAAIEELNTRFKEHAVGYQFESNELIRVDSQFLHAHAVKPTLEVLREKAFKGANEEFLLAHEHYRHCRYKECLVDCLKAFESTMKVICTLRGWTTQPSDTAKNLINTCVSNGLFPSYLDSQVTSLRTLLESGVPTLRNKNGGHGQGSESVTVPEYLARFTLNLTASTILFLAEVNASQN